MRALNGKISPEKKSRNVNSADRTSKHQNFFGVYGLEIIGFWPPHEQNRLLYRVGRKKIAPLDKVSSRFFCNEIAF